MLPSLVTKRIMTNRINSTGIKMITNLQRGKEPCIHLTEVDDPNRRHYYYTPSPSFLDNRTDPGPDPNQPPATTYGMFRDRFPDYLNNCVKM